MGTKRIIVHNGIEYATKQPIENEAVKNTPNNLKVGRNRSMVMPAPVIITAPPAAKRPKYDAPQTPT